MSSVLLGGVVLGAIGAVLKAAGSGERKYAEHLRQLPLTPISDIANKLAYLPPNSRIYAATEGLLVPRDEPVRTTDYKQVIYAKTERKAVERQYTWCETDHKKGTGYWLEYEHENSKVYDSRVRNAGIGIFSGDSAAFVDRGVEQQTIKALQEKHLSDFEQSTGQSINIKDAYEAENFDFSGTKKFDEGTDCVLNEACLLLNGRLVGKGAARIDCNDFVGDGGCQAGGFKPGHIGGGRAFHIAAHYGCDWHQAFDGGNG